MFIPSRVRFTFASPTPLLDSLQKADIVFLPLLPYASTLSDTLVPPIVSCFDNLRFLVHPPSPFLEPLSDLLDAYTGSFPMLAKILPFLNLWLRSLDIPASEFTESCLALMVIAFLRARFEIPDLQAMLYDEPHGTFDFLLGVRPIFTMKSNGIPPLRCDLRIPRSRMPRNYTLESLSMGSILYGFFK